MSHFKRPADVVQAILAMELNRESLKGTDVRRSHALLFGAGVRCFGTWGKALRAAGVNAEVVSNRRLWTRQRVVKTIRALERTGLPLNYKSVRRADRGLADAAKRLCGSWNAALQAAGYDPDHIRVCRSPWTRDEIITLIKIRRASGLPVSEHKIVPTSVLAASRRLIGTWRATLRAAGVPMWSKVSIIEGILSRKEAGQPLNASAAAKQASRLYYAARKCFGGWRQALEEAGLDPVTVRVRCGPYTREWIIEYLCRRAERNTNCLRPSENPGSIVNASRCLFGGWEQALRAAGLRPDEQVENPPINPTRRHGGSSDDERHPCGRAPAPAKSRTRQLL